MKNMYLSNGEKVLIGCSVGVALMVLLGIVIVSCEISSFKSKVFKFLTGEGDGVYYAGNIDERVREIQGDIETMWQGPINQIYDAVVEKPVVDDKDRELCDKLDYPEYLGKCYREMIRAIDLISGGEPDTSEIKCEGMYLYHQVGGRSEDGWHIAYEKTYPAEEWTGWLDYEYLVDNCKAVEFE